jgi:CDP-glucose 4,6-dehydratase
VNHGSGPFGGIFHGRSVLVTGHTGFTGSWLSLWLSDLGANVVGYGLAPAEGPNAFDAMRLHERVTDLRGDIRDADELRRIIAEYRPDTVFHLATQPIVRASYQRPLETYEVNVLGTVKLLEAVREAEGVQAVVMVTSDKCYENREWAYAYREIDPMGGYDPYSSSMGCAEIVTSAYRRSFFSGDGTPLIATVRAGNAIGGGDWNIDRLIPDCVRALSKGESILVRTPAAVRPWQHVLEHVSGMLWLAARLLQEDRDMASAWNLGPESRGNVSVEHVVQTFLRCWGEGAWFTPGHQGPAPHEAATVKLDITKAVDLLGWRPVWDIDQAVDATAEWYRAFVQDAGDPVLHSLDQIDDYVSDAARKGLPWALER